MAEFEEVYSQLNANQRKAVDTIDGPVLVVAGPGTGKTQLLSVRAANILRRTDSLPGNILCLTFTESAALEMRKRLIKLMGPEGNRIAVHTFHSFGADIINQYPEYFYNGAQFSPADDVTSYEILREIFESLPHNNVLAKTMNDEYTASRDVRNAISYLKRAGLSPKELLSILDQNTAFIDVAEPKLAAVFEGRMSKNSVQSANQLTDELQQLAAKNASQTDDLFGYKNLSEVCVHSLALAVQEATESNKTTALTSWRNEWLEKAADGRFVFKDRARNKKLRALAHVYQKYADALITQEVFDFDDMVSLVAHTLETTPELRLNLQEQYQYVMVDEFQDTNRAQLRLLNALTENPINEGRPNILVVGDDDQAIYAFQGAELNNIVDFIAQYTDPTIVVLTDNYRSTAPILAAARTIVTQAGERLETTLQVRKELAAHADHKIVGVSLQHFTNTENEYHWLASTIAERVKNGEAPDDVAIIARKHDQLVTMVPYLHQAGLPVAYERRSNVLESPYIRELLTLAEAIVSLGEQRFDIVEELLPQLLSFDFWGIKTEELWQLSLKAYKERRMWLELMLEGEGRLHQIAEFLIVTSHQALHEPCETMLDVLVGSNEVQVPEDEQSEDRPNGTITQREDFVSPFRDYYFNQQRLDTQPGEYLTLLSNLRALRQALRTYRNQEQLHLHDLIDYVSLCERTNTSIADSHVLQEAAAGVQLLTAHKAKGMEFGTVFVLSSQDDIWGRKSQRRHSSIRFPHNLPIEPAGQHYDDAIRLFFVAMTRAKHSLVLTSHNQNINGKDGVLAEFLQGGELQPQTQDNETFTVPTVLTVDWQLRHANLPKVRQKTLLQPTLDTYRLSATHLNNFIDVSRGGPQAFLLQNLLRFPQSMSPSATYGSAIHAVLARAHTHLGATGEKRPVEDILHDYEIQLQRGYLDERDFGYWFEKGSDTLQAYLKEKYASFGPSQKAERDFSKQDVVIGGARLTGKIDLLTVDEKAKTVFITDYKTGKCCSSWQGKTDYEKIKLHKYRQQLLFYKLLVEGSRDYAGYTVTGGCLEFVEPDDSGTVHTLELTYDRDEETRFAALITRVWQRIQDLGFPDTSAYTDDYKGVLAFEDDLLK